MASFHVCQACGTPGRKLGRCGRCRNAWFCNRECQGLAARNGHSGVNCRPADDARTAADAAPASRSPAAAGPSAAESGADSALLAPDTNSCYACGETGCKLRRCGRCRNAWFCNRECQVLAARNGHSSANCRSVDGAHAHNAAGAEAARGLPLEPPNQWNVDAAKLRRFSDLFTESQNSHRARTRVGYIYAVEKLEEAAAVADSIGGAEGAFFRVKADSLLSSTLSYLDRTAAAARAACSSLRAARASGSRTALVDGLIACGARARDAPAEMFKAEKESRELERLSGSPYHGGLDLSHEGWIRLPTTPGEVALLRLSYYTKADETCVAALAAAGGRGSPAAEDHRRVPELDYEAQARGARATCLIQIGKSLKEAGTDDPGANEMVQNGFALSRQAVALRRKALVLRQQDMNPVQFFGREVQECQRTLATALSSLGSQLSTDEAVEAVACLREALELCESIGELLGIKQTVTNLVNRCGAGVEPAEAEAHRKRLNEVLVLLGRSPETSCSICLESLAPPADAAGGGGNGDPADSYAWVLGCGHQYHFQCIMSWWETRQRNRCPLCQN